MTAERLIDHRTERRRDRRNRSLLAAKIIVGDCVTSADCVIRSHSAGGAQIRLSSQVPLGAPLSLLAISEGMLWDAEVIWRRNEFVGLRLGPAHDLRTAPAAGRRIRALWSELQPRRSD